MASIIGENDKYRNADGKGWALTDKIFGYVDDIVDIYNKIKTGQPVVNSNVSLTPTAPGTTVPVYKETGLFGLTKPWGGVLLIGGLSLAAFGLYKMTKK